MSAIEIHRVALAQREVLSLQVHHELAFQNVDDLRARMLVRLRLLVFLPKFDVVAVELAVADRIVERLEAVSGRSPSRLLRKTNAVRLAHDGMNRPVTVLPEKVIEPDAEDQSDSQQGRQRRKQMPAFNFRQHRRRETGVFA